MALDGIFLYHIKNEIERFAVGSRIEKIHQPSKDELVLTLRSREGAKKLLLSCRADSARIHFTSYAPENPAKPPMLCMLLRKRLTGARITSLTQESLERIIKINLDATNELGDLVKYSVIVEIMGRYSNIILINEDEVIIDAFKRVDKSKSQVRQIMPNEKYTSPPKQDKFNILTDDIDLIKTAIAKSSKKPAKAFQDIVMGVSPIVCREYEDGVSVDEIKKCAQNPTPVVIFNEKPLDFAFMPIKQYGSLVTQKDFESFSELLDFFYYEKVRVDRIKNRSGELFKTLQNLYERAIRKAINRTNELEDCKDKEKYKIFGDLIATNQYALKKGVPFYDLQNYYDENKLVRIPADVMLSPAQNAQKYYREYRKKQVAESKLTDFINEANDEARYLETVIDSLSRSQSDAEITAIKAELADMGYLKHKTVKNQKNQKLLKPMEFESAEGFKIFVGKNNLMNDKLTLKTAKNYDLWFHVKDAAGSHVVVQNDGRDFTDKVIREAAVLAAYNSTAGASSNVPVDYTIIKNVKKPAGAKPGMVIYVDYKTEFVTPDLQEVERIKELFNVAVILGAGNGTRMELDKSKLLLDIGGKTVIERTVGVFEDCPEIDEIIVVCRECDIDEFSRLLHDDNISFVIGGATRQDSVANAVELIEKCDYVVIHDGARPFVTESVIINTLEKAQTEKAAATGVMVKDTIKVIDSNMNIVDTPDRNTLISIQTPQIFEFETYKKALQKAKNENKNYTDDCQLVENCGLSVFAVLGDYNNIKITTKSDITLAENILKYRGEI